MGKERLCPAKRDQPQHSGIRWGEATDEPALARQSAATTAREDARPTIFFRVVRVFRGSHSAPFWRLVAHGTMKQSVGMKLLERITVEPGKCGGRPCIRGLRIRVTDVLGMLAEGVPHEEILRDFPYLEPDDIKAALAYAARQSDHAVLQPA